jgi:hypothetical protein
VTDRQKSAALPRGTAHRPSVPGGNGSRPATNARGERLRRADWTGFTQVDNIVLYCPGLTDAEKVVYSVLTSFDWRSLCASRQSRAFPRQRPDIHDTQRIRRERI